MKRLTFLKSLIAAPAAIAVAAEVDPEQIKYDELMAKCQSYLGVTDPDKIKEINAIVEANIKSIPSLKDYYIPQASEIKTGEPIFRWDEPKEVRDKKLSDWIKKMWGTSL